jgi:flagellar protein FlgJ
LEAARSFEAVFLSKLLEQMRATVGEEGLFGTSAGSDVFAGMFDTSLGNHLAASGRLGLAEMLALQLSERDL